MNVGRTFMKKSWEIFCKKTHQRLLEFELLFYCQIAIRLLVL